MTKKNTVRNPQPTREYCLYNLLILLGHFFLPFYVTEKLPEPIFQTKYLCNLLGGFLHGIALDLGDETGGAALFGPDGESAGLVGTLGDPVHPHGVLRVHGLVHKVIAHRLVVVHPDARCLWCWIPFSPRLEMARRLYCEGVLS